MDYYLAHDGHDATSSDPPRRVRGRDGRCPPFLAGLKWTEPPPPLELEQIADLRQREELLFLVFGDSGTGKPDQWKVAGHMVAECEASGGCDFALMAGDNIYPSGIDPDAASPGALDPVFIEKFEQPYAAFGRLDFWAVPGNHDWRIRGSVDAQARYSSISQRWRMPARDYAVPRLPDWIHIYGLDTSWISRMEP